MNIQRPATSYEATTVEDTCFAIFERCACSIFLFFGAAQPSFKKTLLQRCRLELDAAYSKPCISSLNTRLHR